MSPDSTLGRPSRQSAQRTGLAAGAQSRPRRTVYQVIMAPHGGPLNTMNTFRISLRSLRFSLKSLLLFVTLFCIVIGYVGSQLAHVAQQRTAVLAIRATANCQVLYDYQWDQHNGWVAIDSGKYPADATPLLRRLFGDDFCCSTVVRCDGDLRAGGFSQIARLSSIQRLSLENAHFAEDDFALLARLRNVVDINLAGTSFGDAGAAHLPNCRNLKDLNLDGTNVSDVGMKSIGDSTRLEELVLSGTAVSNAGLEYLGKMTSLRLLVLGGGQYESHPMPIDDRGLVHLRGLKHLECLALSDLHITDDGINDIASLRSLRATLLGRNPRIGRGRRISCETFAFEVSVH